MLGESEGSHKLEKVEDFTSSLCLKAPLLELKYYVKIGINGMCISVCL